jgi:hypothetical protein
MKKKFEGALSTPIIEPRQRKLLAAVNDGDLKKLSEIYFQEDLSKLLLLCRHYNIPEGPHMFYRLSLALACDFIDGFKERIPRGRKLKWTAWNKGVLVVEIERLAEPADPAHGVAWAAKQLAKREPWKAFVKAKNSSKKGPGPGEALRKTYYSYKGSEGAEMMRDAFKRYERKGMIAAWEELVSDCVN